MNRMIRRMLRWFRVTARSLRVGVTECPTPGVTRTRSFSRRPGQPAARLRLRLRMTRRLRLGVGGCATLTGRGGLGARHGQKRASESEPLSRSARLSLRLGGVPGAVCLVTHADPPPLTRTRSLSHRDGELTAASETRTALSSGGQRERSGGTHELRVALH
eukprot:1484293-Rhodomonas_salina.1